MTSDVKYKAAMLNHQFRTESLSLMQTSTRATPKPKQCEVIILQMIVHTEKKAANYLLYHACYFALGSDLHISKRKTITIVHFQSIIAKK